MTDQQSVSLTLQSAHGLVALMNLPQVGATEALRLALFAETIEGLMDLYERREIKLSRSLAIALRRGELWTQAVERAHETLREHRRFGCRGIGFFDDDYPRALRTIPQAPPVLYVKGTLLDQPLIACVGTRTPTRGGMALARRSSHWAVSRGVGVISGLALGIDHQAHLSTLEEGGYTVAVLGGGLACPSPLANISLAHRILDAGGAWVSERPLNSWPTRHALIARDRIQSGLAIATLLAETKLDGGALHTARFTLMQGRRLWVSEPTSCRWGLMDRRALSLAERPLSESVLRMSPLRVSPLQKLVTPQMTSALRLALALDSLSSDHSDTTNLPIDSRKGPSLLLPHSPERPAAIKIQTIEHFHTELDAALIQAEAITRITQRLTRWSPVSTRSGSEQLGFSW